MKFFKTLKLVKTNIELRSFREKQEKRNKIIGFVPTMGALHLGHLSLVEKACKETDSVIISIFVNPTQFNDPSDLERYPRNLEKDLDLLSEFGKIDIVFAPDVKEIYPEPDNRIFDFGNLDKVMEGASRPGHFNGVAQVVSKLFDLVKPHKAYFGQKDFQQLAIIRNLVRQLNLDIEIVSCPIIRDTDGMALSSRNQLLNPEERKHAALISKVLLESYNKVTGMTVNELKEWIIFTLNNDPCIDVEYFELVDAINLKPLNDWSQPGVKVGCVAVKIAKVRLIDNVVYA